MYINTPFNYTGSKFKLLDQIIPKFDKSKNNFIDLFAGGGSVYTNIVEDYNKILVNDIISDLINIHKELMLGNNIIDDVKKIVPNKDDKDTFLELRKSYNENKSAVKLWALMLSSTNNMMRFNKKFQYNQTFGKRSYSDATQKKVDIFTQHIRQYKNKIIFSSVEFYKIKPNSNTFVYIDPPYGSIIKDKKPSNKQISEAGYNSYWSKEHEIRLYEYINMLNDNGNTFMVSGVLEHKGERSWLLDKLISDGYKYNELDFNYSGVARKENKHNTKEIIVMNY
jgi:DNA adenine methylase Dam